MKFLHVKKVTELIGLNKASIYRLMHAGEFPRSIRVSQNRVAWLESEVLEWMESRISARDTQLAA